MQEEEKAKPTPSPKGSIEFKRMHSPPESQFVFTRMEFHLLIQKNKQALQDLKELLQKQSSLLHEAKEKKQIQSKTVSRELGLALNEFRDVMGTVTEKLKGLEQELTNEQSQMLPPISDDFRRERIPTVKCRYMSVIPEEEEPKVQQQHEQVALHYSTTDDTLNEQCRVDSGDLCISAVYLVLQAILGLLLRLKNLLELPSEVKKISSVKIYKKSNFVGFNSNLARLKRSTASLISSMQTSPNELFYLSHSHTDWKVFLSHYEVEPAHNPKAFKKLYDRIAIICASMSKSSQNFFTFGARLALYSTQQKLADRHYQNFIASPNVEVARSIWNMPDQIKGIYRLFFKRIKMDKLIYIPRTDPQELSLQLVSEIYSGQPFEGASGDSRKEIKWRESTLSESPRYMSEVNMNKSHYQEVMEDEAASKVKATYHFQLDRKVANPERYVMVRLLSNKKLKVDWNLGKKSKHPQPNEKAMSDQESKTGAEYITSHISMPDIKTKEELRNSCPQKLIIHIHGGGFIAQSSFAHSTYLRKWAHDISAPILSIDYRLAPEHPYPAALDDCWQVYYWVVRHAQELLGIKPKSIVLVGDSAGANLAVGVTLRAVQKSFRRPDGLVLAYPALNLSKDSFTPSHLLALDDLVLPHSFLTLCLQLYAGQASPERDPFLSPILIGPASLSQFPPVRIAVAGRDPLRDDSFKFGLNLLKAGVEVKVKEFVHFPHGFLNFDEPIGPKECRLGIKMMAEWIKELLSRTQTPLIKFTESWDSFRASHDRRDTPARPTLNDPF